MKTREEISKIRSEVAKRLHKENSNFAMKGKHHSKEIIEKIRLSNINKKHKPHSEETKSKIGLASKNRVVSEETKRKQSETRKKLIEEGKIILTGFNGKHSEITKEKIRKNNFAKQPGYIHPMRGKKHKPKSIEKMKKSRFNGLNTGKITIWNKGKTGIYSEETLQKIRDARKQQVFPIKDTKIEVKIQSFLESLNIEFYTHKYISEITHSYQCDIFIPIQKGINKKTIIECDGNYWHNYPIGTEIDHTRTNELLEKGYRVIRLWETEIHNLNKEELKQKIWN